MAPDATLRRSILFLTGDQSACETLRDALSEREIGLDACSDLGAARERLATGKPALLLLDTRQAAHPDDFGSQIERVTADRSGQLQLVALAHTEDIGYRLAAMRAGVESYLLMPQEASELAEHLSKLMGQGRSTPYRIMVVDDQPVAALFAARVLQGAGMLTESIGDPMQVMEGLERFKPDLVLMDLHMPGASGIELTGVIRAQDRFADLPIVFLSAELDPSQQMAALRIGGDDFLAKPVAPDLLIERVRHRLTQAAERARRLRGPEAVDPVSRLATRERLLQRLDRLIGHGHAMQIGTTRTPEQAGGRRALVYLQLRGDETVLELAAAEVAARIEPGDLAARVGERAIAILINRPDHLTLAETAQRLSFEVGEVLAAMAPQAALGGGWYPLSSGCRDSVTLLSRAGKAAHSSFKQGDRSLGHYRSPARDFAEETALLEAIRGVCLRLLFEPMVALTLAPMDRYELMPRLRARDGELFAPATFAPPAARAGLAVQLERGWLTAGLDLLRERLAQQRPVQLFIHQSLAATADDEWIDWLRNEISARDLIRMRPVLQFETDDVDQHLELAVRRFAELNRLGIRICLNGVDFSDRSRRALHSLSVSFARIGRRMVQGPEMESIAWLIQSLKAGGAKIIATGVDGPETIARLYGIGIDLIQGPYVQPPTDRMEFDFSVAEAAEA